MEKLKTPVFINTNTLVTTLTIGALLAHAAALLGVLFWSRGLGFLLALNVAVASAVLLYGATRARYILVGPDWPYLGFLAFEFIVLGVSLWAFRQGRMAVVGAYVAFGVHTCMNIAVVIFFCTFKLKRLI